MGGMGEGGRRETQERGTYVYLWLIHVDVWQKPTKFCKANIFQLKINKFKRKKSITGHAYLIQLLLLLATSGFYLESQAA